MPLLALDAITAGSYTAGAARGDGTASIFEKPTPDAPVYETCAGAESLPTEPFKVIAGPMCGVCTAAPVVIRVTPTIGLAAQLVRKGGNTLVLATRAEGELSGGP